MLKLDKANAAAAAVVCEVAAGTPGEKPEPLVAMLQPVTNAPGAGGDDVARATWYLAELLYRQFKSTPGDKVDEKVAQLQQLQGLYQQAASMGSAEWAVASLWRIASAFDHLAKVVDATPPPANLKPADLEAFRAVVRQQVEPLERQAAQVYQTCIDRAESLEVFSAALVGCRKRVDEASSPLRGPPPERPVAVDDLQRKAEATQSAADFEALALALLGAGRVNDALLHLNRALELDEARASTHSALGYALLLSGDANAARAAYGRALEADPTFDKARANLAALRCRFFDTEGARREVGLLKDVGGLVGPDVDPEWKSCK